MYHHPALETNPTPSPQPGWERFQPVSRVPRTGAQPRPGGAERHLEDGGPQPPVTILGCPCARSKRAVTVCGRSWKRILGVNQPKALVVGSSLRTWRKASCVTAPPVVEQGLQPLSHRSKWSQG